MESAVQERHQRDGTRDHWHPMALDDTNQPKLQFHEPRNIRRQSAEKDGKGSTKKLNMSSLGHSECPFTNLPSFTPLARRGKMACLAQHQTKHKREKFFALSVVVTKNECRIDDQKMQSEICQLNADGPLHPERARIRKALQKRLRLEDRSVPKKH